MVAEEIGAARAVARVELLARTRLAAELAQLPPWGSAALRTRVFGPDGAATLSLGAHVALVRRAAREGNSRLARDLFTLLISRLDGANARWARAVTRRAEGHDVLALADDLHQEIILTLWDQIAVRAERSEPGEGGGRGEAWELFFQRSLDFARRKVALAFMRRHGLWRAPGTATPTRGVAVALSSLISDGEGAALGNPVGQGTVADLAPSDLADVRALVARLPNRERVAVVLRFWQRAAEDDIARTLGVTPRTVRNLLRRAYGRLRAWYTGAEDPEAREAGEGGDP